MPIRDPERVSEAFGLWLKAVAYDVSQGSERKQAAWITGAMLAGRAVGFKATTPAELLIELDDTLARIASGDGADKPMTWLDRIQFASAVRIIRWSGNRCPPGSMEAPAAEVLLRVLEEEVSP
jgi:hypothetical protein